MPSLPEKTVFDDDVVDQLSDTIKVLPDRPVLVPLLVLAVPLFLKRA